MLEFVSFMLNVGWKTLGIVFGWLLLKYIIRNGTGTIREVLDTIGIGIKAACLAIRKKIREKLLKEEDKEEPAVE